MSRHSLNLKWVGTAIAMLMATCSAFAQSPAHGFTLGGFFDMQASAHAGTGSSVSFGDMELDLARDLGKNLQVSAAFVMNGEGADLAVAFLDIHFLGGRIAPRGRLPAEKGFHVQVGRFDVPFGQDWQYFAAKDRPELSAPLTTGEILGGGYSDVGVRVFGNTQELNYSAFVLRQEDGGSLRGGRLGFAPFDDPYQFVPAQPFEAGISLLDEIDENGRTRARLMAIDSGAEIGRYRLRAEFVRKEDRSSRSVRAGWHLTACYDAGSIAGMPVVPFARFDTVKGFPGEEDAGARLARFTGGMNVTLSRAIVLKLERQQRLSGSSTDAWLAQAVVVF